MKVGLLGVRHVHAEGFAGIVTSLGHELAGVSDRHRSVRDWASDRKLGPVLSRDELIEECDAIIVAGTNAERVEDVIAVVDAGRPVLSEKPVAATESDLRRLARSARSTRYAVALPVRFAPAMQRAREAIRAGHIGEPLAGRATNHGQYPGSWFGDPDQAGGGAIMDHTVHVGDGMCWLMDDRITHVHAEAATRIHDIPVEDCGVLSVTFANGAFASIDTSWSRPRSFHAWGDVWIELVGTEGRLVVDPFARSLRLYDDRLGRLQHVGYDLIDINEALIAAFLEHAEHGGDSPVSLAEGIHASEVVFAAYRSIKTGRREPVEATRDMDGSADPVSDQPQRA